MLSFCVGWLWRIVEIDIKEGKEYIEYIFWGWMLRIEGVSFDGILL